MDKPKKLILDYSKWICGEGGDHQLGEGGIALKNYKGFYCCLGQWSVQCGAPEDEILNYSEPKDINTLIPLFAEVNECENGEIDIIGTTLANDCIDINDNAYTTPDEKIVKLRDRLQKEGIELEVINKP